jgi:hypothetical protein
VVGLVATPPDHPAQVAERLSAELADLLSSRVDHRVRWEVRGDWGAVAPRPDGGLDALLDDVAERREAAGWDIATGRPRRCPVQDPQLGGPAGDHTLRLIVNDEGI